MSLQPAEQSDKIGEITREGNMDVDVYRAPEVEVTAESSAVLPSFYVVSNTKFIVLFVATLGLYSFYWFFMNWKQYRFANREPMWPIARAIFSIFFAHKLFDQVAAKVRERHDNLFSDHASLATTYVAINVVSYIANRLSSRAIGDPYTSLLPLSMLPIEGWVLYRAQVAINLACDDPYGLSNSRITIANIFWILLGAVLWLLNLFGLYLIFFNDPELFAVTP